VAAGRVRLLTFAAALGLMSVAAVVASVRPIAASDTRRTVTIRIVLHYSALSAAWRGTFVRNSSTGSVVDRGTVVDRPRQRLGVDWSISRHLVGRSGTLRFRISGPYRRPIATLKWSLFGGTGAYAGLGGTGTDVEHVSASRATARMSGVPMR
jgi:hypothetical protein